MHQPIGGPFRKRTSGPFASSSRKKSRAPPPSTPSFLHSTSCGETDAPNNTICNLESARSTEEQRHQRWRWRHFDAGGVRPSSLPPPRLQPWLRATRPPPSRKIPIDLLLLPYRSASPYTTRSLEIRWACLRIWSLRRRVATFHVFLVKRKMAPRVRDSCRSCSPVEPAKCIAPFGFCLFTIVWVKDPWRLGRGFYLAKWSSKWDSGMPLW
jgi:hypothetical protein